MGGLLAYLTSRVGIAMPGRSACRCAACAVERRSPYLRIDRKVVAGLRALRYIGKADAAKLESGDLIDFADVYVAKVIPAWIKERKTRSAEAVDHRWGSAGSTTR